MQKKITADCCQQHLLGEIEASRAKGELEVNGQMPLTVGTDVGWQGKGGSRSHNSLSGHNLAIGVMTKKVLDYSVKAKICQKCEVASWKNYPPVEHYCVANHVGSSSSMEPLSTCETTERIWNTNLAWIAWLMEKHCRQKLGHGECGQCKRSRVLLHGGVVFRGP